jgi:hypothetical protein
MDPTPRKHALTHSTSPRVIGKKLFVVLEHHSYSADLTLPYVEESSQMITFWSCEKGGEGYDGHFKQLAGEWLMEGIEQLETVLEGTGLKEAAVVRNKI